MTTQRNKQVIQNINLGGIADSKYSGGENSVYDTFCLNLHEEPGIIKVNQTVVNDVASGDTPEHIISIIHASDGKTYLFGYAGEVWTRDSNALYTSLGTITTGATYGFIYDAKLFDGDIYYSMNQRLGKYTPGSAWSGRDDDFKTLKTGNYKPLIVIENDLYVGNINAVGKVEPSEAATGDITEVLELSDSYEIESFGARNSNLVIGAIQPGTTGGTYAGFSKIYDWDLVSPHWTREFEIKEYGISVFFEIDGSLVLNAGRKGMIYSWNGNVAQPYRRIPGDWVDGNEARIERNAVTSVDGRVFFGICNESGTPIRSSGTYVAGGIFSIGGYDPKYPNVFNYEYAPRVGFVDADFIYAIEKINTKLLIPFNKTTGENIVTIDTSNKKDGAYFITRELQFDRDNDAVVKVRLCYRSLPSGTSFSLHVNKNNTNQTLSGTAVTLVQHANKKYYETSVNITDINTLQLKVTFNTSGDDAPELENITILS